MADFTTYNNNGYTSIPSTIQSHMKGIIENNKGLDYCAFQSSDGTYNLVLGNLKYENGVISGSGTMYTYYYYYNNYSISKGGFDGAITISNEKNFTYTNVTTQQPAFQGVQAVSSIEIFIMFSVVFLYILFRDFTVRKRRNRSRSR